MKQQARKRKVILDKQKLPDGDALTNQEKRLIESEAYEDWFAKLGASASGNDPRNDSDSVDADTYAQPPTKRLSKSLYC